MHKYFFVAAATAGLSAGTAHAAINYDSLGYEVPSSGFAYTGLEGQGGGSPSQVYLFRGTGNSANAAVAATIGKDGTDGVQFDLIDQPGQLDNGDYGVFTADGGSEIPDGLVTVSLEMNVLSNILEGPIFGFTVFGANTTPTGTQSIAADVVVDPEGSLFVNDATPFGFADSGINVAMNVYNAYELVLDYTAKTYELLVNGSNLGTFDFRAGQNFGFTDAQGRTNDVRGVSFVGFDQGLSSVPVAGTAFYDNLVVVPEPALAGLFGITALVGLRRRR